MNTPIASGRMTHIEEGHIRFQNDESRLTVLTWPKAAAKRVESNGSTLVIPVASDTQLPLRIRFIFEDIDTFHEGADEVENYFGRHMKDDFYHPIQVVNA